MQNKGGFYAFLKKLTLTVARLSFCSYLCSLNLEIVMAIPVIESVKAIEQQFNTGEEPVLVTCSDMNTYICKYMRSSAAAYKLVCELIGAQMAISWQLDTPEVAFVKIKPSPKDWNIATEIVESKLTQLFDKQWIDNIWDNFMECLNENSSNE